MVSAGGSLCDSNPTETRVAWGRDPEIGRPGFSRKLFSRDHKRRGCDRRSFDRNTSEASWILIYILVFSFSLLKVGCGGN
jgi:hypothetical protein